MVHAIRNDLKKNVDDGVRHWISLIGKYREANLEPMESRGRGRDGFQEPRSMSERFRRTEHAIRRPAENHLTSALMIRHNRLTERYEFADPTNRGRASMLGMSMLGQLLEEKPEHAIWPFTKPKQVTIFETLPWVFTGGREWSPKELKTILASEEDHGLEFGAFREQIIRKREAQIAFRTALGMIKAETRENRAIRPLRDYPAQFYDDELVHQEGWIYGVGYRVAGEEERSRPRRERAAA